MIKAYFNWIGKNDIHSATLGISYMRLFSWHMVTVGIGLADVSIHWGGMSDDSV